MTPFWIIYSILIVVASLITIESKGELIEVSQINSNLSLDIQLEKKFINSNNKQTIGFFLQDTSNNKTIDAKIEGNIIYLSGMAESFSINITNNQLYNYSWIINPKIQFYGTILLDIYMIYNGSKFNIANLSFSIDDNHNKKNDRNKNK
ncbi:MAG TPA: hypothetical protein VFU79_07885 [Nitrososphaeraceae archaeon]|nr:hypothetical protein [Nitrososphaeraceae archaeon]